MTLHRLIAMAINDHAKHYIAIIVLPCVCKEHLAASL